MSEKIEYIRKYCYLCQATNCKNCPVLQLLYEQEGGFDKAAGQALNRVFNKLINSIEGGDANE